MYIVTFSNIGIALKKNIVEWLFLKTAVIIRGRSMNSECVIWSWRNVKPNHWFLFLTPGTENFSDVVWKSPDAVHALLPPCFVYKKAVTESWYNYFTLNITKTKKLLGTRVYSCMRQLEFQDACTFLRNVTETDPLPKNVRKRLFFIRVAMKYKAVKYFGKSFKECFQYPILSQQQKTKY